MRLQVARVLSPITALGPGRRVAVWVQGCTLACQGCASRDTWDAAAGSTVEVDDLAATLTRLYADDPSLSGLTVTGGEPLQQPEAVAALLRAVRASTGALGRELDVLVFTGYAVGAARRRAPDVLGQADAVVAGRYLPAQAAEGYLIGSANQRLELLTPLGERRFGELGATATRMQAIAADGDLVMVGVPRTGDLDRLTDQLAARGVVFGAVSWQG